MEDEEKVEAEGAADSFRRHSQQNVVRWSKVRWLKPLTNSNTDTLTREQVIYHGKASTIFTAEGCLKAHVFKLVLEDLCELNDSKHGIAFDYDAQHRKEEDIKARAAGR